CEKCAARRLRERRFRFLETTLTSCTQPCKKLRIPKQVRFKSNLTIDKPFFPKTKPSACMDREKIVLPLASGRGCPHIKTKIFRPKYRLAANRERGSPIKENLKERTDP
ncbi:MAG: hypothetical protein H7834_16595, partial [Magnetococcus sp. YQC-9]